jgi:hypothetical protein
MIEQKMAQDNLILEAQVGSKMYGTNTEDSDTDLMGIFMPNKDYTLGIMKCEQVEIKTNPSSNPQANTKDDIDRVIYSLPKFISMLVKNNPTALELLFARDSIVYDTSISRKLTGCSHLFVSQKAKHTYVGYAFSQKAKVLNKKDRYSQFVAALEKLDVYLQAGVTKLPVKLEMNTDLIKQGFWKIIEKGEDVLAAKQKLEKELAEYGRRLELVKRLGYDPKFICHVVRLLDEGIELLTTGALQFPLKSAPLVLDIKLGNWTLPRILKEIEDRERLIEEVYTTCKLQHSPDIAGINELQIELLEEFYYAQRGRTAQGKDDALMHGVQEVFYGKEVVYGPEPTTTIGHNRKEN